MIKIKFQSNLDTTKTRARIENMGKLTSSEAKELGQVAVDEMKRLVARGESPVRGRGFSKNFPAYKRPEKYPGRRKPHTPVNLELDGDMLADLSSQPVKDKNGGYSARVGYGDPGQAVKEKGHRKGTNDQPKRPTIPKTSRGEKFAEEIMLAVRNKLREILRRR